MYSSRQLVSLLLLLIAMTTGCTSDSNSKSYIEMTTDELMEVADYGDEMAQFTLGYNYAHGIGTSPDYTEAAKWYLRASEQGNAPAQYNLGTLYANGTGVIRSKIIAHMWWTLSAELGLDRSKANLEQLEESMNPEMLEMASEITMLCRESSFKDCVSLP